MIHIPLYDHPPKKAWLKKAELLTKQLEQESDSTKRNEIIKKNETFWKDIKPHLEKLSHKKCWYSEAGEKYSYYHIDHFRPKKRAIGLDKKDHGGYWWLTFDWKNYRLCGSVGNTSKGDQFYVRHNKAMCHADDLDDEIICFLDPVDEEDVLKITFTDNGEMVPTDRDDNSWDNERANYTIKHLNLNYEPLKEARRELWDDIKNRIFEIDNLMDKQNQSPSSSKKATIKQKLIQLKKLKAPQAEFSATVKACLLKSNIDWAMNMATG